MFVCKNPVEILQLTDVDMINCKMPLITKLKEPINSISTNDDKMWLFRSQIE